MEWSNRSGRGDRDIDRRDRDNPTRLGRRVLNIHRPRIAVPRGDFRQIGLQAVRRGARGIIRQIDLEGIRVGIQKIGVRASGDCGGETVELVEKLKFANAVSPIDNPMKIRNIKKDIARLSTELSNR